MGKKPINCKKCGELHYCDDHHILPKGIYGEGETAPLCKNCHDKYHRQLGAKFTRKENAQPKEFYTQNWMAWITAVLVVGAFLYFL